MSNEIRKVIRAYAKAAIRRFQHWRLDGVIRAYAKADRRHGIGNIRDPLESRFILAFLVFAAIGVWLMAAMGWLA